jgi:hypothetical protein
MPSAAPRSSLTVLLQAIPLDRSDDSSWHKSSSSHLVRITPIGGVSARRPWPHRFLSSVRPASKPTSYTGRAFPGEFVPAALKQSRHPAMTVQRQSRSLARFCACPVFYQSCCEQRPQRFRIVRKFASPIGHRQERNGPIYFKALETDPKTVLRLCPMPWTTVIITTETDAASSPYSMAVAPDSSRTNVASLRRIMLNPV